MWSPAWRPIWSRQRPHRAKPIMVVGLRWTLLIDGGLAARGRNPRPPPVVRRAKLLSIQKTLAVYPVRTACLDVPSPGHWYWPPALATCTGQLHCPSALAAKACAPPAAKFARTRRHAHRDTWSLGPGRESK